MGCISSINGTTITRQETVLPSSVDCRWKISAGYEITSQTFEKFKKVLKPKFFLENLERFYVIWTEYLSSNFSIKSLKQQTVRGSRTHTIFPKIFKMLISNRYRKIDPGPWQKCNSLSCAFITYFCNQIFSYLTTRKCFGIMWLWRFYKIHSVV